MKQAKNPSIVNGYPFNQTPRLVMKKKIIEEKITVAVVIFLLNLPYSVIKI